ncbi:hypothetical protein BJV82DRAFT_637899 [Fennellomyces sp. T-0311]|nr:hypothetical protein BJV82DRAFT_637899 [Fennellomyces sp. T-0311]
MANHHLTTTKRPYHAVDSSDDVSRDILAEARRHFRDNIDFINGEDDLERLDESRLSPSFGTDWDERNAFEETDRTNNQRQFSTMNMMPPQPYDFEKKSPEWEALKKGAIRYLILENAFPTMAATGQACKKQVQEILGSKFDATRTLHPRFIDDVCGNQGSRFMT